MRQGSQAHLEPEVLHCLQDFVQDGDHAPTPVDDQCGPQGCLIPRRSSAGTVPQVQLAGPVLQVRGSTIWPVLSTASLHQDSGPSDRVL